jgi:hypothetical protein
MSGLEHFKAHAPAGAARHVVIQAGSNGHQAAASAVALVETSGESFARGIGEILRLKAREGIIRRMRGDILGNAFIAAGDKGADCEEKDHNAGPQAQEIAR